LKKAESLKLSNVPLAQAGLTVVQNFQNIQVPELAGVLMCVFAPVNTSLANLALALCKSYVTPNANDIASGIMTVFYETNSANLGSVLYNTFNAIGKPLTQQQADAAIAAGFKYVGKQVK
jgi:hypothetical protein